MTDTVAIEFGLPNGAGGQAAAHSSVKLRKHLTKWADQRRVDLALSTVNHDYRYWIRVTFRGEQDLTLFALSWQGESFMPWQRVEVQ
jgi:hypothetical protein